MWFIMFKMWRQNDNCTECDNKYSFLFENKCINCSNNCEIKDSDNCKCKICKEGFFLKDSLCEKCNMNCLTCEGNSDNCTNCKNHFFLNNEKNVKNVHKIVKIVLINIIFVHHAKKENI